MEIRDEPRLRRIVGHLAVYQKATELILVTKMHQERARRLEEQIQYVDGDLWPEFSRPRKAPTPPSSPSPYSGVVVRTDQSHTVPRSYAMSQVPMSVEAGYVQAKQVATEFVQVIHETAEEEFTIPVKTECVYGVVHIRQEQGLVLPPVQIQVPRHMSSSAAIQFWHILMQSLSKFCNRKGHPHSSNDLRQLEAYGIYPRSMPATQRVYPEEYYWYGGSVQLVV